MAVATVHPVQLPLIQSETLPCRWRGFQFDEFTFACKSVKLSAPKGVHLVNNCSTCYCRDHEPVKAVKILNNNMPPANSNRVKLQLGCIHRGDRIRKLGQTCGACSVFRCSLHTECVLTPNDLNTQGLKVCMSCEDRKPRRDGSVVAPSLPNPLVGQSRPAIPLDHITLCPGTPGLRFNPSIIEWKKGYLYAFRNGWRGSEIYVVELDKQFKQVGQPIQLNLTHSEANYGREDPRLFIYNSRLHISYTGVVGGTRIRHTNVLYARLSNSLQVEQIFFPRYAQRSHWEKNWQFFEWDKKLYATYTVAPHKILRIEGENATVAYETSTAAPWNLGTEMRGGASPVKVGDEYYSFFHSRVEQGRLRVYLTGLYTFEAKPPFAIKRIIPQPIDVATPANKPADQYASVVWAGGAVRSGDDWAIATGIHDRWSEVRFWNADQLENELVEFSPPTWWNHREWWADPGIWTHVVGLDEYRIGSHRFSPKDVIIDIGAHVGCFAYRVHKAGARKIDCYEPFGDSVKLLKANAANLEGVKVYPEAIGGQASKGRMAKPTESNSGSGNVTLDPKGDVDVIPLDKAIRRGIVRSTSKRIALLKIDAEGAEWEGLGKSKLLGKVDAIVGEWHPPGGEEGIRDILESAGFLVECVPTEDGRGLFFARR